MDSSVLILQLASKLLSSAFKAAPLQTWSASLVIQLQKNKNKTACPDPQIVPMDLGSLICE